MMVWVKVILKFLLLPSHRCKRLEVWVVGVGLEMKVASPPLPLHQLPIPKFVPANSNAVPAACFCKGASVKKGVYKYFFC